MTTSPLSSVPKMRVPWGASQYQSASGTLERERYTSTADLWTTNTEPSDDGDSEADLG